MKLYQQLADDFATLIRAGTLQPGERMPDEIIMSARGGRAPPRPSTAGLVLNCGHP